MRSIALLITAAIFLVSCHDDDPPTPTAQRTIIAFFPWSVSLNRYINNSISLIETAIQQSGLDSTRVLIYQCTHGDQAQLFELTLQDTTCTRNTLREYTYSTTPYDYTTTNGIANIFQTIMQEAPAQQYSLIIGCHGMGWLPIDTLQNKSISSQNEPMTRYFGGTSPIYQIETTTLAQAMDQANLHTEYIAFDNCYMASIEVAFDLKNHTNYIIACPTEIMALGFPYDRIGPFMLAQPNYSAIVSEFHYFYSNYTYPYASISVTKTDELNTLANIMQQINASYNLDTALISTIQTLDTFLPDEPTIFFDLASYAEALCNNSNLLDQFNTALNRAVPYKAHTPTYYNNSLTPVNIHTFSGLSTSDPSINPQLIPDKYQTNYYYQTH